jgi:hypothetical protein
VLDQLVEDQGVRSLRVRARREGYDHLTISLLRECPVQTGHLDNCAECKNLRGGQDNDTYADLANTKCIPSSRHPTEEGYARGVVRPTR